MVQRSERTSLFRIKVPLGRKDSVIIATLIMNSNRFIKVYLDKWRGHILPMTTQKLMYSLLIQRGSFLDQNKEGSGLPDPSLFFDFF
jgi:hypothetical protein